MRLSAQDALTSGTPPVRTATMGKHLNPRRKLSGTPEDFDRWDRYAKRLGLTWANWARRVLNGDLAVSIDRKKAKSNEIER